MRLFDVYPLFDINIVRASGSFLWDDRDIQYLDLYGGHAVISVGHSHPNYLQRIREQLEDIGFYSNSVKIPLQQQLADLLGQQSGYDDYQLFLCNSGAEANENAFKLASFHTGRKKIIAFTGAFHGRTSAAVAATDTPSIVAPVNESENVVFCSWEDKDQLETLFAQHEIAAVIIEGIQGVGGVRIPSSVFLQTIAALCKKNGAIFIADEIQSGYGRSGQFFAHQNADVRPDIITMAKGMGNGFPVAGVLIAPSIRPKHGMLGTTFGGNYLACSAGLAVLEIIRDEQLMSNAEQIGNYIRESLSGLPGIKEIRGRGLMIGIELPGDAQPVRDRLLRECRIFTGSSSQKNTLRILPALNISKCEADMFIKSFREVMHSAKS